MIADVDTLREPPKIKFGEQRILHRDAEGTRYSSGVLESKRKKEEKTDTYVLFAKNNQRRCLNPRSTPFLSFPPIGALLFLDRDFLGRPVGCDAETW